MKGSSRVCIEGGLGIGNHGNQIAVHIDVMVATKNRSEIGGQKCFHGPGFYQTHSAIIGM